MRYRCVVLLCALVMLVGVNADAQQPGLIVRDNFGRVHLSVLCPLIGCSIVRGLGDPQQQVFLVAPVIGGLSNLLQLLPLQTGIVNVELDQLINLQNPQVTSLIPSGLSDASPIGYYGSTVWNGYVNQPASAIVRISETQSRFHVSGAGVVAIIDTGLDPQHPALAPVVLTGYDFTRNTSGADETGDLDHSTSAVLDDGGGTPLPVSPALAAVLPPLGAALLGDPRYAGFGHGTMTAGIVHMVAPTAQILPLKAFSSDGTGYLSNIVQAIYYAAGQGSRVLSMSFSFQASSPEMVKAIQYATNRGVICVAAAGNDGQQISVYPASLNSVMGVASTSNTDTRSSFSNYGSQVVWVAAPGENIISTYPYGTYASSSGTSFSTPFVAGTASLLVNVSRSVNQSTAAAAIAQARYLSSDLNHGRLDTYQAVGSLGDH